MQTMKLTKVAPALSLLAIITGSAAFAQDQVRFRYDVMGSGCCPTQSVMTQSAVIAPACSTAISVPTVNAVLEQPAVVAPSTCGAIPVVSNCESTALIRDPDMAAVITPASQIGTSMDPYRPLWMQAILDTSRSFDRVCGLPAVCETAAPSCDVMTNAAVIEPACGVVAPSCGVITQPAVIAPVCNDAMPILMTSPACTTLPAVIEPACAAPVAAPACGVIEQPAIVQPACCEDACSREPAKVITQPMIIQGDDASDIRLIPLQ
jgi:hypothetical protein